MISINKTITLFISLLILLTMSVNVKAGSKVPTKPPAKPPNIKPVSVPKVDVPSLSHNTSLSGTAASHGGFAAPAPAKPKAHEAAGQATTVGYNARGTADNARKAGDHKTAREASVIARKADEVGAANIAAARRTETNMHLEKVKAQNAAKATQETKPLLGNNPRITKHRTNTDILGDKATAKSIFRNQTKGQEIAQQPLKNGGIRRTVKDGTQIRMNPDGSARLDLPKRGLNPPGRETIHVKPPKGKK
jgi:hypothetical protein